MLNLFKYTLLNLRNTMSYEEVIMIHNYCDSIWKDMGDEFLTRGICFADLLYTQSLLYVENPNHFRHLLILHKKKMKKIIKDTTTWLENKMHMIILYWRYQSIKRNTDKTVGDKFRTMAAKFDALEEYHKKYCDADKVGRLNCNRSTRKYNKVKNQLKKETLLLLYNV